MHVVENLFLSRRMQNFWKVQFKSKLRLEWESLDSFISDCGLAFFPFEISHERVQSSTKPHFKHRKVSAWLHKAKQPGANKYMHRLQDSTVF